MNEPEGGGGQGPVKPISRTKAKQLRSLHTVAINKMTDGRDRALKETSEELQLTRQKLTNASAVLEAVVRRHGPQTFDRKDIQSICARGHIQFDVTPTRITVRLRSEPLGVEGLDTNENGKQDTV